MVGLGSAGLSTNGGFRLLVALVAIGVFAGVGVYSYNLGVAHGLAQSGHALTAPGAGPRTVKIIILCELKVIEVTV